MTRGVLSNQLVRFLIAVCHSPAIFFLSFFLIFFFPLSPSLPPLRIAISIILSTLEGTIRWGHGLYVIESITTFVFFFFFPSPHPHGAGRPSPELKEQAERAVAYSTAFRSALTRTASVHSNLPPHMSIPAPPTLLPFIFSSTYRNEWQKNEKMKKRKVGGVENSQ